MKHTPFPWVRKGCLIVHEDKNGVDHVVCDLTPTGDRDLYQEDGECIIEACKEYAMTKQKPARDRNELCKLLANAYVDALAADEVRREELAELILNQMTEFSDDAQLYDYWEDLFPDEPNPFAEEEW